MQEDISQSASCKSHSNVNSGDRPTKQPNDETKFKEKLAKQKFVWRKESMDKKQKSGPLIARHVVLQSSSTKPRNNLTSESQHKKSLRPTSPTYESAFKRQVVNSPQPKGLSSASSFRGKRTPSPNFSQSPDELRKQIEKAKKAQLYLLQQAGPNSFIISSGGTAEQKHKVIIGQQSCTCAKGPHCIHILFVMVRVFQLGDNDMLLYSKSLKNFEVESLLRKYENQRKQRLSISNQGEILLEDSSSSQTTAISHSLISTNTITMEITCPICLLEFQQDESQSECDNCHNRLHLHCMTIWYQLVVKQGEVLSCPLCRAVWTNNNKLRLEPVQQQSGTEIESTSNTSTRTSNNTSALPHVTGLSDIEPNTLLPRNQQIPADQQRKAESWVQAFGDDLIGCLFMKSNWVVREAALRHLSRAIVMKLSILPSADNDNTAAAETTEQETANRQIDIYKTLDISCQILTMMVNDPVYKVYVAALRCLRTMLSYCALPDASNLSKSLKPVIHVIILKCADGNRKTNQLSLSTLCEFAKGQDGELAVARELNVQDQPGLGGCLYVMECCLDLEQSSNQHIQWVNGRLLTIAQIMDEFPNSFVSSEKRQQAYLTKNIHLPTIKFAVSAINKTGNQTRTLRLAKKIILWSSKCMLSFGESAHKIFSLLIPLDFEMRQKLEKRLTVSSHSNSQQESTSHKIVRRHTFAPQDSRQHPHDYHHDHLLAEVLPEQDCRISDSYRNGRRHLTFGAIYRSLSTENIADVHIHMEPVVKQFSHTQITKQVSLESGSRSSSCESVVADVAPASDSPTGKQSVDTEVSIHSQLSEAHVLEQYDIDNDSSLKSPFKSISRGRTLSGKRPLIRPRISFEEVEPESPTLFPQNLNDDEADGLGMVKNNGNVSEPPKFPSEHSSMEVDERDNLRDSETYMTESVSLDICSDSDMSVDNYSLTPDEQYTGKNLPFRKYRNHARSQTDPFHVKKLLQKKTDSSRCVSDPTADKNYTGSFPHLPVSKSSSQPSKSSSQTNVKPQSSEPVHRSESQRTSKLAAPQSYKDHPSFIPHLVKPPKVILSKTSSSESQQSQELDEVNADSSSDDGKQSDGAEYFPVMAAGLPIKITKEPQSTVNAHRTEVKRFDSGSPPRLPKSSERSHSPTDDENNDTAKGGDKMTISYSQPSDLSNGMILCSSDPSSAEKLQASHLFSSILGYSTSDSSDDHKYGSDSLLVEDLNDSAGASPYEKPVSFKSEVALFSTTQSPPKENCQCKDEVELEEAIALAKAMELSSVQAAHPQIPGLSSRLSEETITIHVQSDQTDGRPSHRQYLENVHWKRGMMIGTGAFSTCYQCRDVKTGIMMAVKQISFCRNSEAEQENICKTVVEEIKMMAGLNHPNVVRILGATKTGAHFNMFVEWMPGGSVSHLLQTYGPFSEPVITSYSQQILLGLAYLHENGILHRDMKGANLLVDSTGKHLRIGDFGACARLASTMTGAGELKGQLLGTIAFMAPEVLRGEHYGRACDVWSVGCVIIEMTTTKPPWNASNVSNHLKLIFMIASANSAPPIPPNLSPAIRDLMLRCLEVDSKYRPSARELLQHPLYTRYAQYR